MKIVRHIHIYAMLFVVVFGIILSFVDVYALKILLSLGVLLLLIVLIAQTSGVLRISFTSFFVLSLILNMIYSVSFENMLDSLNSHTIFIALFVCTPLIGIPIHLGGYMDRIMPLMRDMPRKFLPPVIIMLNFVFTSFLNLGGPRVVDQFFYDTMKQSPVVYGKLLSRSFSFGALWTPYFAAFSVAVTYSGSNPSLVILFGLFFCLFALGCWSLTYLVRGEEDGSRSTVVKSEKRTILEVAFFLCLIVASVVFVSHFTELDVILIISLLSVIFSLLWSAVLGKTKDYFQSVKTFVREGVPSIREEAFLFISIGFFASTLLELGWKIQLPHMGGGSLFFIFLFIIVFNVVVAGIALTGVHHLVTITIIATAIDWERMGMVPVAFAMTILLSWCLSSMLSPFSPPNLLISRITNRTTFQIGMVSNRLFGMLVLLGGAIYLTMLNWLLG